MEKFCSLYNKEIPKIFETIYNLLGNPKNNLDFPEYYVKKLGNKIIYLENFSIIILEKESFVILTNLNKDFEIVLQNV